MLIFSWNCCLPPWSINRRKRIPKIISAIVAISPDLVCLQEGFFSLAVLDVLYGKGFQTVQFLNKGERFSLINTHLLSAYADDSQKYQTVRDSQSRELLEVSEKLLGDKKILVGDFNFQPATFPYTTLVESNFIDTTTKDNTT